MKGRQRKLLSELMECCNALGGTLDGTSTNEAKYRDRQRAHMKSYQVLLAVLSDHPENDQLEHEYELAEKAISEMKELKNKKYTDRAGNH